VTRSRFTFTRLVCRTLALVCLVGVGSLVPDETAADHPVRLKGLIRVNILAPPHVPGWYVAELGRRMEASLGMKPRSMTASSPAVPARSWRSTVEATSRRC